jgi:histidinol dehydrogenase
MKIYKRTDLSDERYRSLLTRPATGSQTFRTAAASLCRAVQAEGDAAVRRLTKQFDKADIDTMRIDPDRITSAASLIAPEVLAALQTSIRNVRAFHAEQRSTGASVETTPGVRCWQEIRPIRRVGLYVPAGSAPLPSTLIMLGVPALLAGCSEIAVCTPPDADGNIHPAILATAAEIGLSEIYRVGGAQAIAAMAFGTASIPRVDKIFGPGNAYVTAAKEYVSIDPAGVPIDLAAGPSELLIIADESADPALLAADLLSQAEHDPSSQVVLVCTDQRIAEDALSLIGKRLPVAPRKEIIEKALENSFVLLTETMEDAVRVSNEYAPEHLSIQTGDPSSLVSSILNAGSVFLGRWAPVTAGDYASGTNHTLPTSGTSAAQSGVTLASFCKTMSFQDITEAGLRSLAPTLRTLSTEEALAEHTRAVEVRVS